MKLVESDPSLAAICRLVEVRLAQIPSLAAVELPVVLLPHFNDLGPPVTRRDPVAYNRPGHKIFVNGQVFPSFSTEAAQFALAHEIGHHVHHAGIAASLIGSKGMHPCLIADWLAAQWGFSEEMRMERLADRGPEYCDKLSTISSEAEFLEWVSDWEPRYRAAKRRAQNTAPRSLGSETRGGRFPCEHRITTIISGSRLRFTVGAQSRAQRG